MYKLIFLTVTCLSFFACNQRPGSTAANRLVPVKESPQNKYAAKMDTAGINIDAVKTSPGKFRILLENDYVRVVEYSLKPGEKDSTHTHPPKTSYVISGGRLRVYPENEKPFDYEEVKGVAEWAGRRGKHYVENTGNTTVTILLTEIKNVQ